MKKNGGNSEDVKEHHFENAGFINDLIGENFVNFNPRRDIFNITFTFPKNARESMNAYIKHFGKEHIVHMIMEEVERCQSAEAK